MNVKKSYHDALVSQRNQALVELEHNTEVTQGLMEEGDQLRRELAEARAELRQAQDEAAPSDMADDLVEVFSQALTEWLVMYDFSSRLGGMPYSEQLQDTLRADMLRGVHFLLRHTASEVDTVLDQWQTSLAVDGMTQLVQAVVAGLSDPEFTFEPYPSADTEAMVDA